MTISPRDPLFGMSPVMAGEQGRMTPASLVAKAARKYRILSTYEAFDNHAHWLVEEPKREEVAERVNVWLQETLVQG